MQRRYLALKLWLWGEPSPGVPTAPWLPRPLRRLFSDFVAILAVLAVVNVAVVTTDQRWRVCVGSNVFAVVLLLMLKSIPVSETKLAPPPPLPPLHPAPPPPPHPPTPLTHT